MKGDGAKNEKRRVGEKKEMSKRIKGMKERRKREIKKETKKENVWRYRSTEKK